MNFKSPHANVFIPDASSDATALNRCTHLAIGAHPDDVELIGMHGIQTCYRSTQHFFVGVVVTDGAGSPRSGKYATVTNEEMVQIRIQEQIEAAKIGEYSAQIQLGYPSNTVKTTPQDPIDDIKQILMATQPHTLYLHNPLDRHVSHRAVLKTCISALRQLPAAQRPTYCYGVEVWRSLDFLPDHLRVSLPTDKQMDLSQRLIHAFHSQVEGGKRYDLAFAGRGLANATFAEAHAVDEVKSLSCAIDLNPLINDSDLTQEEFAKWLLQQLINEL